MINTFGCLIDRGIFLETGGISKINKRSPRLLSNRRVTVKIINRSDNVMQNIDREKFQKQRKETQPF